MLKKHNIMYRLFLYLSQIIYAVCSKHASLKTDDMISGKLIVIIVIEENEKKLTLCQNNEK